MESRSFRGRRNLPASTDVWRTCRTCAAIAAPCQSSSSSSAPWSLTACSAAGASPDRLGLARQPSRRPRPAGVVATRPARRTSSSASNRPAASLAPAFQVTRVPEFTLYGDGTVLYQLPFDPNDAAPIGPPRLARSARSMPSRWKPSCAFAINAGGLGAAKAAVRQPARRRRTATPSSPSRPTMSPRRSPHRPWAWPTIRTTPTPRIPTRPRSRHSRRSTTRWSLR